MPWPDFTELTFGFAFLREFEQNYVHGGRFPKAPDFISQGAEATKGYDVKIAMSDASPVYLQLKRSYVLVTKNAKEIRDGLYSVPKVYRMHMHKSGYYRQHKALQDLERLGNAVFYVTSQIHTPQEFAKAYDTATIVSHASALFSPNEIILPDDTGHHHVSFKSAGSSGYVYSSEPNQFKRKFAEDKIWRSHLLGKRQSLKDNRKLLQENVKLLKKKLGRNDPIHKMMAEKRIEEQAAILAYFLLDAQLTFVKK